MESYFEKIVQNFELKRVEGAPKGHLFTPLCITDSQLSCTRLVIFLVLMLKTACLSYLNVHTGEHYDHVLMKDFPQDFRTSFLYLVPCLRIQFLLMLGLVPFCILLHWFDPFHFHVLQVWSKTPRWEIYHLSAHRYSLRLHHIVVSCWLSQFVMVSISKLCKFNIYILFQLLVWAFHLYSYC